MKLLSFATAFCMFAAAPAFAAAPVKSVDTAKGAVLAADNGMSLYTFKKDEKGISNCYEACATAWPPFIADGNATPDGAYSLIDRKDGSKQWAKDGMPLYFWMKDKASGDITGDGFKDVWNVARP